MITETILSFSVGVQCKSFFVLFYIFLTKVLKSLRERKEEGDITQRLVTAVSHCSPSGWRSTGGTGIAWTLTPSSDGPAAAPAASEPISLLLCRHLRVCWSFWLWFLFSRIGLKNLWIFYRKTIKLADLDAINSKHFLSICVRFSWFWNKKMEKKIAKLHVQYDIVAT